MLPFEISAREDGQGLVEYALLLGLVSIAAVAALILLGTTVLEFLETVPGAFTP